MIDLYQGDCLEKLDELIKNNVQVDMILCDPPYGTTAHAWDKIIPFDKMWERLKKLIKPNGVICLFSMQPFTSQLICSNLNMYRYSWIWKKNSSTGFLNANYRPLTITEDICIFSEGKVGSRSKNKIVYYPQDLIPVNKVKVNNPNSTWREGKGYGGGNNQLNNGKEYVQKYTNYPTTILEFKRDKCEFHPTQKPIDLLEYLVKTYTLEGETVLDFTMGSGSTGVACKNTNRNFIGIEKNEEFFDIAKKRMED